MSTDLFWWENKYFLNVFSKGRVKRGNYDKMSMGLGMVFTYHARFQGRGHFDLFPLRTVPEFKRLLQHGLKFSKNSECHQNFTSCHLIGCHVSRIMRTYIMIFSWGLNNKLKS